VYQSEYPSSSPDPVDFTGLPVPRRRRSGLLRRVLWSSVPVWSIGMLSFVPFLARALSSRRRPVDWIITGGYLVASALEVVLVSVGQNPADPNATTAAATVGGGLALVLMGAASTHSWITYRRPGAPVRRSLDRNAQAVAVALGAAQRRSAARRIAESDPALARDLKIGRPDLERTYDDGGLVDVNHAPAELLARVLGWTAAEAQAVVRTRSQAGGFSSTAELSAYTELDPRRIDAVADLLVFLP
jgi:DNA uptake protein ComE-like DNA-binding protein